MLGRSELESHTHENSHDTVQHYFLKNVNNFPQQLQYHD